MIFTIVPPKVSFWPGSLNLVRLQFITLTGQTGSKGIYCICQPLNQAVSFSDLGEIIFGPLGKFFVSHYATHTLPCICNEREAGTSRQFLRNLFSLLAPALKPPARRPCFAVRLTPPRPYRPAPPSNETPLDVSDLAGATAYTPADRAQATSSGNCTKLCDARHTAS